MHNVGNNSLTVLIKCDVVYCCVRIYCLRHSNYIGVHIKLSNCADQIVMHVYSSGDVRCQVPVRLVQEDLHALRHLLLQQRRLWRVQMLRLNATSNDPIKTTQQERFEHNKQGT